jgi:hypothetical protein
MSYRCVLHKWLIPKFEAIDERSSSEKQRIANNLSLLNENNSILQKIDLPEPPPLLKNRCEA